MTDIAIGVITYKRPDQLQRLLRALARQKKPGGDVSVIVIDNDAAASARSVATSEGEEHSSVLKVHYCVEEEPGIVAARNRCVQEFLAMRASCLAFIDDDEWPQESDWLCSLCKRMQSGDADVVAGDVLSVAGQGTPEWATQILYQRSSRQPGERMPVFYTGNVMIARRVFEHLNPPFDSRFAMTGASDYHFALRCSRAGYVAVFADAPVLEEFPAERANLTWFLRRGFRSGAGYTRSHLLEDSFLRILPRMAASSALRMVRGLGLLALGAFTFNTARQVKGLFRIASGVGTVAGLLGLHYQEYRQRHAGH